tara:strand:+ start:34002 stop:35102 length:1101 start_codon:yes stop_codon:yes gene_type:complete
MKKLVDISRYLVSVLFIISGLIKANDSIGFSYKLEEYFEVFGIEWLGKYALLLAVGICIFEIMLGFMLFIGSRIKFTIWSLFIMIIFFTFLTFYSAYFNKVTDCGCFGDAIKLTPWQSFYKDLILIILLSILCKNISSINSYFVKRTENIINLIILLACSLFVWITITYLPLIDFRPYAIGKNIPDGMIIPDGAEQDVFNDIWYYDVEGKILEFSTNDEPWSIDGAKYIDRKTVLVKKGYEPPIHDFSISSNGIDITDSILEVKDVFIVISYNIIDSDKESSKKLNNLYLYCKENGITFVALSASSDELIDHYIQKNNIIFSYCFTDETTLKTIIRSNPGILRIKEGTIINKWHYNDFPFHIFITD